MIKKQPASLDKNQFLWSIYRPYLAWFIPILAAILYLNTVLHDFVLDDAIVLSKNEFVQKGISGIPDILSKDTFKGFFKKEGKDKLISGGRYRPLTLVVFAVLFEIFGNSAFVFHLFMVIAYSALCWLIYKLLSEILKDYPSGENLAIVASLLFAVHPVHTESVANIKGLDEVFALGFSLLSYYLIVLYLKQNRISFMIGSVLSFLIALFSKENAIVYLALIPIYLLFIRKPASQKSWYALGGLACAALFFILVRSYVLNWSFSSSAGTELMNNSFLKWNNGSYVEFSFIEKLGTISFTLWKYFALIFFPYPLTHDYYPRHIGIYSFHDVKSILGLVITFALFVFGVFNIRKNPWYSFAAFAYLLPLILVSNLFFPVGTNMGERFLFMPSFGIILLISFYLIPLLSQFKVLQYVFIGVLLLFSIMTVMRNPAWKNDFTLFSTDVKTSTNSAKINNAMGGILIEGLHLETDSFELRRKANTAIRYLDKAIEIHPLYYDAIVLKANAYYYLKDFPTAVKLYQSVLAQKPGDESANKNLPLALREYGRDLGMNQHNPVVAKDILLQAYKINPSDIETIMLLGIAEGSTNNNEAALKYFDEAIQINPENAQAHFNKNIALLNLGRKLEAEQALMRAKELDPQILSKNGIQ